MAWTSLPQQKHVVAAKGHRCSRENSALDLWPLCPEFVPGGHCEISCRRAGLPRTLCMVPTSIQWRGAVQMGTWGSQNCRAWEGRESINVSWKENEACSNKVLLIEGKGTAQSTKVACAGARGRQMRMKRGWRGSGGGEKGPHFTGGDAWHCKEDFHPPWESGIGPVLALPIAASVCHRRANSIWTRAPWVKGMQSAGPSYPGDEKVLPTPT